MNGLGLSFLNNGKIYFQTLAGINDCTLKLLTAGSWTKDPDKNEKNEGDGTVNANLASGFLSGFL